MSVIDKLKRLHKQSSLKLKDIKRAVVADEAGVNNAKYLNRGRTLGSYLNNQEQSGEEDAALVPEKAAEVESAPASTQATTVATATRKVASNKKPKTITL